MGLLFMLFVACSYGLEPYNLTFEHGAFRSLFDWPSMDEPKPTFQYDDHGSVEIRTNLIKLSVPPITPWSSYNSFNTLKARTYRQAMALQTDLLRTHVVQWLYACTKDDIRVPVPAFATDVSIAAIRLELFEHGYANVMRDNAFVITVPNPIV